MGKVLEGKTRQDQTAQSRQEQLAAPIEDTDPVTRCMDWREELTKSDKWENVGRIALEEHCTHFYQEGTQEELEEREETDMLFSGHCDLCDRTEESGLPLMNRVYAWPFQANEDEIRTVVLETNCTVMRNTETDEYFLTVARGP